MKNKNKSYRKGQAESTYLTHQVQYTSFTNTTNGATNSTGGPSMISRRDVPAGNITAATGTAPRAATTCCSHLCQTISQALQRTSGTTQPARQRDLYCTQNGTLLLRFRFYWVFFFPWLFRSDFTFVVYSVQCTPHTQCWRVNKRHHQQKHSTQGRKALYGSLGLTAYIYDRRVSSIQLTLCTKRES